MHTATASPLSTTRRDSSCLLRLHDVSLDRGPSVLLHDVELSVARGEVVLCTGPNGAGKTTLLRVLAGVTAPTSGRREPAGPAEARIELLGHAATLHPDLTLAENLDVVARLHRAPTGAVPRALEHVGLAAAADRRAGRCSAGMQRRTEFARLRMTSPELLLLDEPDVALDETARVLVEDAVATTVHRGGAVVVATHAPERLEHVATSTWTVRDGTVRT